MQAEIQQSLFDTSLYGGKKIRGHYNKRDKTEVRQEAAKKIEELTPYAEFAQVSASLASYLPMSFMTVNEDTDKSTDYGFIVLNELQYNNEDYDYYGEKFKGEKFKIVEAELKGTEKMAITYRLELHKKLLGLIRGGLTIYKAAEMMQDEIKRLNIYAE